MAFAKVGPVKIWTTKSGPKMSIGKKKSKKK